jgi:hypothetical protein
MSPAPLFVSHVIDDYAGTSRSVGLVRGPGGSVAVAQGGGATIADAHREAERTAREAAAKLCAGLCRSEWDLAIDAKEEAEAATGDTLEDLKALAGIPTKNPLGRYFKARAELRVALGLRA